MKVQTLAEQLLFTTVHVECHDSKGNVSVGTAFVIDIKRGEKHKAFLVTNKHVVAGAVTGYIRFHLKNGQEPDWGKGYRLKIKDFEKLWIGHKDPDVDVTVMSMSLILAQARKSDKKLFYRSISLNLSPTKEEVDDLDAVEEVLFIGYPNGIFDAANYLPVVRRGITASPLQIDHEGRPRFLIDAAVFGGSSGSPVFLVDRGAYSARDGGIVVGRRRIYFLGLVAAGYYQESTGVIEERPIPTANSQFVAVGKNMLNLGIVYKASTICELVEKLVA
jgi:hypothetical protein